ncbi:hypothetical protein SynBIOSE41_00776 [Synechococcus sp. BIOS-E4-1]|uniref:pilus assembly FimT family protein n=1 Tax=Synechococcus sp. BIOS-E4-1 TaxID=1400864 RepID=UPI001645280F|nr:type II secretion system protein [Synechococcus sp. BIOS-E4-1]QNI53309.1 hypothetical protein SynBIOSE41_00776 [Synechococcus sp. BIOS-E4-1]
MTCNNTKQKGFSLVELIVGLAILSTASAITVPIITRNWWQVDVDRYASQLESGIYGLRAKLGSRKTSCSMMFPAAESFMTPETITEFSQGKNRTDFKCCDSEISQLIDDTGCMEGYAGNKLSEITGRPLDNLRLVQKESAPESQHVRVAVSTRDFGFTPPGTTANAGTLTFLICHQKALSKGDPTNCIPGQERLSIRCIQIDGTGAIESGNWINDTSIAASSNGRCQAT